MLLAATVKGDGGGAQTREDGESSGGRAEGEGRPVLRGGLEAAVRGEPRRATGKEGAALAAPFPVAAASRERRKRRAKERGR